MEITSRYEALGVDPPDPATMCRGQCEGTGVYPVRGEDPDLTPAERQAWAAAETKAPSDDGYHFIQCIDCGGTGKHLTVGRTTLTAGTCDKEA